MAGHAISLMGYPQRRLGLNHRRSMSDLWWTRWHWRRYLYWVLRFSPDRYHYTSPPYSSITAPGVSDRPGQPGSYRNFCPSLALTWHLAAHRIWK